MMRNGLGAEHPLNHVLQIGSLILFLAIWTLDSYVYRFSTHPAAFVPFPIRLILAGILFSIAFLFLLLSHRKVINKIRDPPMIIESGVYGRVRHPMYLGILLFYAALIISTLSLVSLALWVGIFLVYDSLATYEEKDLIRNLGTVYAGYLQRVPKWMPRISREKGRC